MVRDIDENELPVQTGLAVVDDLAFKGILSFLKTDVLRQFGVQVGPVTPIAPGCPLR